MNEFPTEIIVDIARSIRSYKDYIKFKISSKRVFNILNEEENRETFKAFLRPLIIDQYIKYVDGIAHIPSIRRYERKYNINTMEAGKLRQKEYNELNKNLDQFYASSLLVKDTIDRYLSDTSFFKAMNQTLDNKKNTPALLDKVVERI